MDLILPTLLLFTSKIIWIQSATTLQSCSSPIYCQGKLLETIQIEGKLFNDSKSFVDLIQINDQEVTLSNFEQLMNETNNDPSDQDLKDFLNENFKQEGELDEWTPEDYKENPAFLRRIVNEDLRRFAQDLVKIWPKLARKVKSDVKQNPNRHSLIYLPNGFIIPGGRFKEIYYWDSYWIVQGLLVSEMTQTVKGILSNFISLVQKYGFIPNGARVYYLNRSQPPLLAMMVSHYIEASNDLDWLSENIEYIEAELNWWLNNRTVEVEKDGTKYTLARYASISGTPRPESYSEDVTTCSMFKSQAVESCYKNLKSGAESGWDFSTRWISPADPQQTRSTYLPYTNLYRVIPVDLNSILCRAFKELSKFYTMLGDSASATIWAERSATWQKSIEAVFYDRTEGIWFDYDLSTGTARKGFYPSNFAPLWTDSYNTESRVSYGGKAAEYARAQLGDDYKGGIPTSKNNSGEQWDLPNAWPPLQEIVITGLYNSGNAKAMQLAHEYATNWVQANHIGYGQSGEMFEKYSAVVPGQYGGGGEYVVQNGFGWTNGVVISFLNKFPDISSGN